MVKGRIVRVALAALLLLGVAGTSRAGEGDPSQALGAELLLLTAHIMEESFELGRLYDRRLSSDGRFVLTPGIELSYDRQIASAPLGIDAWRLTLAGYRDSVDHRAGYAGLLARWDWRLSPRLELSFGIGPTLIFREDWKDVPGYEDDGFFNTSERFLPGYQYLVIPGGDLDLRYRMTPRLQLVWSVVPGLPYVITQSLGVRWGF